MTHSATFADTDTLPRATSRLIAFLNSDGVSPGVMAALRRCEPNTPDLKTLGVIQSYCQDTSSFEVARWARIAKAIAIAGPALHKPGRSIGRALREAGFSEQRMERFLATPEGMLDEVVYRVARFLKAKHESFDQVDLARLLTYRNSSIVEAFKLRLAQAYLN